MVRMPIASTIGGKASWASARRIRMTLGPTAEVARHQPQRHPDQPGQHDGRHADQQRCAGAKDQPSKEIAAKVVGAERKGQVGPGQPERRQQRPPEILVIRIAEHERGEQRDHDDEARHHDPDPDGRRQAQAPCAPWAEACSTRCAGIGRRLVGDHDRAE